MKLFPTGNSLPHRSAPLLVSFVATLVAAPAAAQDRTADIDRIFSFATAETPGCAVGVSQHGKVVVNRAYGLADVDRRVPLSPNSKFDIGSVQKQFTAASVLLLVEDGRISLSDDVRKYIKELPDYGHRITVNHLLTQTSGVRDWPGLLPMAEEGVNVTKLILRQRGLNFTPGDEWSYSSSGYELAKELVARVSGMSFAEFTRRRLFEPLGMKSSAYVPDIMQGTGERALAYQKEGTGWKPFMRLGNERAGGAVITTPGDLLIWNDALTTGRLGKSVTARLHEPTKLNNGRTLTYGRALMLDSIPGGRMVWHDGGAAGYGTWLGRFTDEGLSLAVMCNFEPVSVGGLVTRVANLFLPPVDPQARQPGPVAAAGVDISGREGLYLDARTGDPLRLVINNGRLSIAGGPVLVPVSADRFRPQRTSLFFRSQDDFELAFRSVDAFEWKSKEGQTTPYVRAQPYSATASDLQAVDGRYSNEDFGTVFEVLPTTSGLVLRFEQAPDRVLFYEPLARDTYILNTGILRFRRDPSGKVTGLSYSSPMLRNVSMTRLGDRKAGSPAAPVSREPVAATPTAPRPEGLVGEYEMAAGRSITVTLENGQLYGEPTGNPRQPLVHVSGATYAVGRADGPITLTFTLGADGRATAMVMRQSGNERTLPRVR